MRGHRICSPTSSSGGVVRVPGVPDYWNHNTHYHRIVLDAVPGSCETALDVGCGDGLLARKLAARVRRVTGIDRAQEMIRVAQAQSLNVTFIEGDFLEYAIPVDAFDFVCSVATAHHMDFDAAVMKMVEVLKPGGTLVIISVARDKAPVDYLRGLPAIPANLVLRLLKPKGDGPNSPIVDPSMTWSDTVHAADHRQAARDRAARHRRRNPADGQAVVHQRGRHPTRHRPYSAGGGP
jgi:SAM-dependent methyltransferase